MEFRLTDLRLTATVAEVTVSVFGDGNRTVVYNFTLAADNGDTIVLAAVQAYLDLTLPVQIDFGQMSLGLNTVRTSLNVRCNTNYQVDVTSNRGWHLTQWNGMSYGSNLLSSALQIASEQSMVSEGSSIGLIQGGVTGQALDSGQDWLLSLSQTLRYADPLLPSGETYHMELTFNAYITF
jgi:hypothetical protein